MTPQQKIMMRVKALLKERGKKALALAQQAVLEEKISYEPLQEALQYFMKEVWFDVLHPALLSLACEAVGGNPDETTQVGAALILLAGGADVHDDIIDQSITKGGKPTVFGKFGKDLTLLAGDALLFKGLYLLHDAIKLLPEAKMQRILDSVRQAFLGISAAEAKEAGWRGRTDISGQEYLDVIKMKVAVAEATTRIGAILGNGSTNEVEMLSHYGRTFGILNTVRDEYIDVFEVDELKNRAGKEILPLPILVAFQDSERKAEILRLLKEQITEDKLEKILDLTLDSEENRKLTADMKMLVQQERRQISVLKSCQEELQLLLVTTLEDI